MPHLGDERRRQADELTHRAERLGRAGDSGTARALYAEAAELEAAVALEVPPTSPRVRSLLAESAVSLWFRAGDWRQVELVAQRFFAKGRLEPETERQLRALVADARSLAARAAEGRSVLPNGGA